MNHRKAIAGQLDLISGALRSLLAMRDALNKQGYEDAAIRMSGDLRRISAAGAEILFIMELERQGCTDFSDFYMAQAAARE